MAVPHMIKFQYSQA